MKDINVIVIMSIISILVPMRGGGGARGLEQQHRGCRTGVRALGKFIRITTVNLWWRTLVKCRSRITRPPNIRVITPTTTSFITSGVLGSLSHFQLTTNHRCRCCTCRPAVRVRIGMIIPSRLRVVIRVGSHFLFCVIPKMVTAATNRTRIRYTHVMMT